MTFRRALLDANVLYPAVTRDLLMQFAVDDLYEARWSAEIEAEWIESLLRNEPHRSRQSLERTRDWMNLALPGARVSGHEQLIESLVLPDPDDRHVLAAAIASGCTAIITRNLRDFPPNHLAGTIVVAEHPDQFLFGLLDRFERRGADSVEFVRASLTRPPYDTEQHFAMIERAGLVQTAAKLRAISKIRRFEIREDPSTRYDEVSLEINP